MTWGQTRRPLISGLEFAEVMHPLEYDAEKRKPILEQEWQNPLIAEKTLRTSELPEAKTRNGAELT